MIVVDSHQKVLSYWAEYRSTLTSPPRLLTLDHHTDTSAPFRTYLKSVFTQINEDAEKQRQILLSQIDYKNSASLQNAIKLLSNDEHIVSAIKSNIISAALVIAHNARNTDIETYREHKIICRSVDNKQSFEKIDRYNYDKVLESSFLQEALYEINQILTEANEGPLEKAPYILDIDLDYFNTFNSIKPSDHTFFKQLAKNAGIITVATEDEYVKNLAQDSGLTSQTLLAELEKLLS